jgi:hypothetical protein
MPKKITMKACPNRECADKNPKCPHVEDHVKGDTCYLPCVNLKKPCEKKK